MNEAIRFRVWDKVFNEYWTDEQIKENASWLLFPNNANINDIEFERYIGIKDRKGKPIFAGDLILLNGEKWKVVWVDEECSFFFASLDELYNQPIYPNLYIMSEDFEVIGNIRNNELLEK